MDKTTTVRVKQRHINKGLRQCGNACPIALALRDIFPEAGVDVGNTSLEVNAEFRDPSTGATDYRLHERKMPPIARRFVHEYDHGYQVSPFAFEIEAIGEQA